MVAKDLAINVNTLHTWIGKYSRPTEHDKTVRTDEHLYDELKRLKKEVARLAEERDLLKKAAACFVRRHLGATWVLKLDITRFFESISERQIYYVFRRLGYRALVAFCLTRLCTRVLPASSDMRLHRHTKRWRPGKET